MCQGFSDVFQHTLLLGLSKLIIKVRGKGPYQSLYGGNEVVNVEEINSLHIMRLFKSKDWKVSCSDWKDGGRKKLPTRYHRGRNQLLSHSASCGTRRKEKSLIKTYTAQDQYDIPRETLARKHKMVLIGEYYYRYIYFPAMLQNRVIVARKYCITFVSQGTDMTE